MLRSWRTTRSSGSGGGPPSVKTASRGAFRKRRGCFEIQTMSARFVTAQKPGEPGGSNQAMGCSRRRRFQAAWG